MYEWEVKYSETKREGSRISCESWKATVYAADEEEVRRIMSSEEPGKTIDKIVRGGRAWMMNPRRAEIDEMKTMINEMVSRFLCWKLPKDFAPDCGISFKLSPIQGVLDVWPTGTNLFHAGQAQEMFRHCLPPTWHPMATAPKDGTVVLGLVKGSDIPHPMRWAGHWWQSSWDHHDFFHDAPWCWMAIPDSPNPNDLISGD